MDLDGYRVRAEAFTSELTLDYYRHYAGLQDDLEVEAIYDRHADLFSADAVLALRDRAREADGEGDEARRLGVLADFAVEGHLGLATRSLDAQLARTEAAARVEVDGESIGFRESAVTQANEPDPDRRERIEQARLAVVREQLNPLHREGMETWHALSRELGWPSYLAMCSELKGVDLEALERQTAAFAAATEEAYPRLLEPQLRRVVGMGVEELRRSDLPWFFRFEEADALFPAERLVPTFRETMAGLGIDLDAQDNVILDVERRPTKSPRAFCAPVHVPQEVYLVIPPMGGRDDYAALFHEGGHAQHFGWVRGDLPWEFRLLGDNAVTEGFAFLFDHLIEDAEWLRRRMGVEDAEWLAEHARASRLVYLRRYGAKLAYELELHAGERPLDEMAGVYSQRLSDAVRVEWPADTYLADVDPGFYVASYLRAWALETRLRATLRERFGPAWFDEPEAGDLLRRLWSDGQRLRAEELLAEVAGGELDFGAMLDDLRLAA